MDDTTNIANDKSQYWLYCYVGLEIRPPIDREIRQFVADMKMREEQMEEDIKLKTELIKLGWTGTINNLHPPDIKSTHSVNHFDIGFFIRGMFIFIAALILLCILCSCQNPNKIQYVSHNAPVEIVCFNCPDTISPFSLLPDSNIDLIFNCDSSVTVINGHGKIIHDSCNIKPPSNCWDCPFIEGDTLKPIIVYPNYTPHGQVLPYLANPGIPTWHSSSIDTIKKKPCYDSMEMVICTYPPTREWFYHEIPCPLIEQDTLKPIVVIGHDSVKWKPYYKSKK